MEFFIGLILGIILGFIFAVVGTAIALGETLRDY